MVKGLREGSQQKERQSLAGAHGYKRSAGKDPPGAWRPAVQRAGILRAREPIHSSGLYANAYRYRRAYPELCRESVMRYAQDLWLTGIWFMPDQGVLRCNHSLCTEKLSPVMAHGWRELVCGDETWSFDIYGQAICVKRYMFTASAFALVRLLHSMMRFVSINLFA